MASKLYAAVSLASFFSIFSQYSFVASSSTIKRLQSFYSADPILACAQLYAKVNEQNKTCDLKIPSKSNLNNKTVRDLDHAFVKRIATVVECDIEFSKGILLSHFIQLIPLLLDYIKQEETRNSLRCTRRNLRCDYHESRELIR